MHTRMCKRPNCHAVVAAERQHTGSPIGLTPAFVSYRPHLCQLHQNSAAGFFRLPGCFIRFATTVTPIPPPVLPDIAVRLLCPLSEAAVLQYVH
jgi:hypothetical protein